MKRYLLLAFAFLAHVILLAKSDDIRVMSFNIRRSSPSDGGEYSWISRKAPCVKAIKKEDRTSSDFRKPPTSTPPIY